MAPQALGFFSERPGAISSENGSLANNSHDIALKPFLQTHFGRMPPELRERVFIELLATPPSHAGHDFTTIFPAHRKSTTAPQRFVYIQASWHQVTRTCRQVYVESRPIFFAAKSYYLAKPQELAQLLGYHSKWWERNFRLDTITALCLKDFVREITLYTKEQVDEIMSNPNDYRSRANTRQELAERTFKTLDCRYNSNLRHLKNLMTIGLCFLVSEETLYIDLLYSLTDIQRGLVEFVDASHWLIRPQNPEDNWSIQYACFRNSGYGRGKDNEIISYDRLSLELEVTDIDSRAPGLQEGDERYVEVQIQWPVMEKTSQEPLDSNEDDIDWLTASGPSNVDLSSPAFREAQLELPQDHAEDDNPAETSEYEDPFAELESDLHETDQSLFLGLDSEYSCSSQLATDADQEEDGPLLEAATEEVSDAQPATQNDHPIEDASQSSLSALIAPDAPVTTGSDRLFLPETDDEDAPVQTDAKASELAAHADLLHTDQSHVESEPGTEQVQHNLRDRVNGRSRRKNSKYPLGSRRQPLLEISNSTNPHTEEEMKFYEEWQERQISGTYGQKKKESYKEELTPPLENLHGHRVEDPPMASTTATPQEERSMATSRAPLRLLVRFIQACTLYLLSLILAMITRPTETPPDDLQAGIRQQRKEHLSEEK